MKINFISECVHYSDVSHYREQKILNGALHTISKVCFSEMEINTSIQKSLSSIENHSERSL